MRESKVVLKDIAEEIEQRIEAYIEEAMRPIRDGMDYMRKCGWQTEEEVLRAIRDCENLDPPLPVEFNIGYVKGIDDAADIVQKTVEPGDAEDITLWLEEHKCTFLEEAGETEEALKPGAANRLVQEPFYSAGYVLALKRAIQIILSIPGAE